MSTNQDQPDKNTKEYLTNIIIIVVAVILYFILTSIGNYGSDGKYLLAAVLFIGAIVLSENFKKNKGGKG